jgi:hypothetical protein
MRIYTIFILALLSVGCANTHLTVRSTSTGDGGGLLGAALHKVTLTATVPLAERHSKYCDSRGGNERREFKGQVKESSHSRGTTSFVFRQDCRDRR